MSPVSKFHYSHRAGKISTGRFRFKAPHRIPATFQNTNPNLSSFPPSSSSSNFGSKWGSSSTTSSPSEPPTPEPPFVPLDRSEPSFAEALFDALSSFSAAEYWTGVFGQPIHIYPRPTVPDPKSSSSATTGGERPASDAEYAAYVKMRVWQNTMAGMQERASVRAAAAATAAAEAANIKTQSENAWQAKMDAKIAATKIQRRTKRQVKDKYTWAEGTLYLAAWNPQPQQKPQTQQQQAQKTSDPIPWPIAFSTLIPTTDTEGRLENFFERLARHTGRSLKEVLKEERLRWHPDKIMQRFGVGIGTGAGTGTGTRIGLDHGEHGIKAADADVEVMHRVNEVWRAIDGLYRRSLKGLI